MERYLGDGVYASYDGHSVILELREQSPTWPITTICLEPSVMDALEQFRRDAQAELSDGD